MRLISHVPSQSLALTHHATQTELAHGAQVDILYGMRSPYPGPHHQRCICPPVGLLPRPPSPRTYPARTAPRYGGSPRRTRLVSGVLEAGGAVANGGGGDNVVLRVSQDRLAAHLMFAGVLSVTADWRFAHEGSWPATRWMEVGGRATQSACASLQSAPSSVCACVDLNCCTDMFVVGIDTCLVCNKFPLMGGCLRCHGQVLLAH